MLAAGRVGDATMMRAAVATTVNEAQPLIIPGRLWRATIVIGDVLGAAAIALCIPFVILAIGTPIALCVRLLLWMVGML